MPRFLKYLLIGSASIVALLLLLVGYVAATFNPNDYKGQVIKLVEEKKQRKLAIPGTISLKFFPKIGADLGAVTLSEHKSETQFAAIESASVSLALLPLLKKELVVDKIRIEGVRATLIRHADGKLNIDDLLSQDKQSEDKLRFDIDGVQILKSGFVLDDRQAKRRLELSDVNLETGKIANGVASKIKLSLQAKGNAPKMDAKLALTSGFTIDLEQQNVQLDDLEFALDGKLAEFDSVETKLKGDLKLAGAKQEMAVKDLKLTVNAKAKEQEISAKLAMPQLEISEKDVKGDKISGSATITRGKDKMAFDLQAPSFQGNKNSVSLPQIVINIDVTQEQMQAKGKIETELQADLNKMLLNSKLMRLQLDGKQGSNAISANISSPFVVNLKDSRAQLTKLNLQTVLPHPAKPNQATLTLQADGNLEMDWQKQSVVSVLKGKLDETSFDAKLGMNDFAKPHYRANLLLDKIDADRYRAKPDAAEANKPATDATIDLSGLANLRADVSLQVASVKVANMQMANMKLQLQAQPGKLEIAPLAASLYGGNLQGSLVLLSGAKEGNKAGRQQIIVKQNLNAIALGPLLKDAIQKNPIDGKGNVTLDISTEGASIGQFKKALAGSARLSLQDGSISGFNLAQIIRDAKAKMGGADTGVKSGTSKVDDKTDFSELSASFKLNAGVAHNEDLSIKSPLFRIGGNGDLNLGEEKIDYLVKPTVVSTLQGQGGPELQALKGLTVPVRLTGPFTAMAWQIDFGAMAKEAAAQKVNEKKEEVKTKLQDKIKDSLKGLFGK